MRWLKNRWVAPLGGCVVALAAGLAIAWAIFLHGAGPSEPPPASQGGLVIVSGRDDDAKLDPQRPLRCFVNGQFVGELPLADCAKRNGVATGSLDVGLDPAGALAAGTNATDLTPLNALAPAQPLPVTELAPPANTTAAPPPAPEPPPLVNAVPLHVPPVQHAPHAPAGQPLARPPGAL